MPTQLDNTWLPPETRTGGDGSDVGGPFDYGSGEYNKSRIGEKVFNGKESERVNGNYGGYEYSTNIRVIIEHYETWAKQSRKEVQKITDGKETITIDDLLWYLRYEKKGMIAKILGEDRLHNNEILLQLPSQIHSNPKIGHIPHTLMHTIRKSIDELGIKK